jgi:RNA polymerase sigma-70 factor (ECF subfamily)
MPRVTLGDDAPQALAVRRGQDTVATPERSHEREHRNDRDRSEDRAVTMPDDLPSLDPRPSFEEVATQYGPAIYSMAYRLTGNDEEARDLAQDVFVRVYRNLDKYQPGTFQGWLYRITKNLFLDRVRKRRRYRLEPLPDEDYRHPVDDDPGPSGHLDNRMLRGDLERALVALPPTFRTAVVLCDVQGLSYEEIADATGWPLGTVRSRIHRGRRMLRETLLEDGGDDA